MELKKPYEKILNRTSKKIHRIKGIDKLRGFAILFMLLFHGFQFYDGNLNDLANASASNPMASIIKFLGRWAGIFVIISGFVNTISIYHGIKEKKKTPKSCLKGLAIIGLWFIGIEHLFSALFFRTTQGGGIYGLNEGPLHYSVVSSWLETGTIHWPTAYSLYMAMSAISGLGLAIIFLGIILFFLFRKEGIKKSRRNIIILGTLGTLVILGTPLGLLWLRPIWINSIKENKKVLILLTGIFIADTHPLFPLLGYILYGSALGLAFAQNIPRKLIVRIFGSCATIYIVIGSILYALFGEPPLSVILQTTPIQVMFLQIGLMIWFLIGIYWFNANPNLDKTKKKSSSSSYLEKFGKVSLTIYLVEGFLGTFFKMIILNFFFPEWASNFTFIVIYSLFLIFLWSLILVGWEKIGYKYSLEWITYHHIKSLARKKRRVQKNLQN